MTSFASKNASRLPAKSWRAPGLMHLRSAPLRLLSAALTVAFAPTAQAAYSGPSFGGASLSVGANSFFYLN